MQERAAEINSEEELRLGQHRDQQGPEERAQPLHAGDNADKERRQTEIFTANNRNHRGEGKAPEVENDGDDQDAPKRSIADDELHPSRQISQEGRRGGRRYASG